MERPAARVALTKVKTLYSIMMEKQRKMAYSTSTYTPSRGVSRQRFRAQGMPSPTRMSNTLLPMVLDTAMSPKPGGDKADHPFQSY
ncbi:hypothetical protein CRUP_022851 [Coryphaenoides rupestris]|nr:hypothetical protein CRUP_022851 [Coryphaenoides rupestris]